MSRAKLPRFGELLASTGIDLNAKYQVYFVDADKLGVPGSHSVMSHEEAFDPSYSEEATTQGIALPEPRTAWVGPSPPTGSESLPKLYGRRLRTRAENTFTPGDALLIQMGYAEENAAPRYQFDHAYEVGDMTRNGTGGHTRLFRCVAKGTSSTTESTWASSGWTQQPGGPVFALEGLAVGPYDADFSQGNLTAPLSVYPVKVSGYDTLSGSFVVETNQNPEKHGSVGPAWALNTNFDVMAELGNEDFVFAISEPFSAGIPAEENTGIPTMQMITEPTFGGKYIRLYNYHTYELSPGLFASYQCKIFRQISDTTTAHFAILAKVANHWSDTETLPFDEQEALFAWGCRSMYDDTWVVDTSTGLIRLGNSISYMGIS